MELQELIAPLLDHYNVDVNYQMHGVEDADGVRKLGYGVEIDLRNDIPIESISPFIPVASVEQAKEVVFAITPNADHNKVDAAFNSVVTEKSVDLTSQLFFTMYKVPRANNIND